MPQGQGKAQETVLSMHEIRAAIGLYLDHSSLEACSLVSTAWRTTFFTLFWQHLCLPNSNYPHHSPDFAFLEQFKHGFFKCTVNLGTLNTLDTPPATFFSLRGCSRLTCLTLRISGASQKLLLNDQVLVSLASFVQGHRETLSHFELDFAWAFSVDSVLWNSIADCRRLWTLKILRAKIREDDVVAFWKACLACQGTLEFSHLGLPVAFSDILFREKQLHPERHLTGMSTLSHFVWRNQGQIAANSTVVIQILCSFPSLTSLTLQFVKTRNLYLGFRNGIQAGLWKHLESVTLAPAYLNAGECASFLESITDLRELRMKVMEFSRSNLRAIGRFYQTLVVLDLKACMLMASKTSRTILENCSKLRVLTLPLVDVKDLLVGADAQPWVCTGLEELALDVIMCVPPRVNIATTSTAAASSSSSSSNTNLTANSTATALERTFSEKQMIEHDHVFEQLSHLTRLKSLSMHSSSQFRYKRAFLQFRLDVGLWRLDGLQQLESLTTFGDQAMRDVEVGWIKSHWPRLKRFVGPVHGDAECSRRVVGLLEDGGVCYSVGSLKSVLNAD